MKAPNEPYDLDAEIAKYGGRVSFQMTPVGQHIEATIRAAAPVVPNPAPYDLDAEIVKYGGQTPLQPTTRATTEVPLAALDHLDPSLRTQIEIFANILSASVYMVIPRRASDPRMLGRMPWHQWERRRLDQIFREGHVTSEQACDRGELQKRERAAWLERERKIQHGWAKWMRWRFRALAEAEEYRREHEDGRIDWLLDLADQRTPLGGRAARKKPSIGAIK